MSKDLVQLKKELMAGFRTNYGNDVRLGVQFAVDPTAVQQFEEKKRQEFAFLNEIDFFATDSNHDQIISMVDGKGIDQSSKTGGRRPISVGALTDRQFLCREIEQDVQVPWSTQVAWGRQKTAFYNIWRAWVLRARARGTLRTGFWGQKYAVGNSDISTNLMGEDVQTGWLQYMILNYPQNVFGIVSDGAGTILDKDGVKYKVSPINIGEGGDFINIAQLVQYLKDTFIELVYRGDTGIKAICGDSLRSSERQRLLANADTPMQNAAIESLLGMNQLANMQVVTPDEFPTTGLLVTNPMNIQYIYQTNGVYREIREWADTKATQDLMVLNRDYVIPVPEAFAMVHPDALRVKNSNGDWVNPTGWAEWSLT